jgi:hypothetical protein
MSTFFNMAGRFLYMLVAMAVIAALAAGCSG